MIREKTMNTEEGRKEGGTRRKRGFAADKAQSEGKEKKEARK